MARKLSVIAVATVILASMTLGVTTAGADDSSNTVVKGVVYVGSDDGIYALDAATGAIIWTTSFISANSPPVVVKGVIYYGSDDGVYMLDATTGEVLGLLAIGAVNSSSVVVKGVIYFGLSG